MRSKAIMLCNGPLSGQAVVVDSEYMSEYAFFERGDGSIIHKEVPTEAIVAKRRVYYRSKYKFGDYEIFIWEEDFK
jgi:hypothetical protein